MTMHFCLKDVKKLFAIFNVFYTESSVLFVSDVNDRKNTIKKIYESD